MNTITFQMTRLFYAWNGCEMDFGFFPGNFDVVWGLLILLELKKPTISDCMDFSAEDIRYTLCALFRLARMWSLLITQPPFFISDGRTEIDEYHNLPNGAAANASLKSIALDAYTLILSGDFVEWYLHFSSMIWIQSTVLWKIRFWLFSKRRP